MTLQTKLTVRLTIKIRDHKTCCKTIKEITMSNYIRTIVLKDIRSKNESRTEQLKANKK